MTLAWQYTTTQFITRGLGDDAALKHAVATQVALAQCRDLYALGVRHFHFYTLNRAELVLNICRALGVGGQSNISKQIFFNNFSQISAF